MAESAASPSPTSTLEKNVASVAMAEYVASPSPTSTLEMNDTILERSFSEAMDTDIKVDVSLSEALNAGPNEVTMVSSLRRDAANVGAKEISVDESHRSEAVMLSRPPAPTKLPGTSSPSESRVELLQRVQALKKDLEDWRGKLDTQVKSYREELGDLRSSLNLEVDQLRHEFQGLRNTLQKQRELASTKPTSTKLEEPSGQRSIEKLPHPAAELTG